jgi:hypothetical protein
MPQKGYPSIGSYLLTAGVNSSAGFMMAKAPTTLDPSSTGLTTSQHKALRS